MSFLANSLLVTETNDSPNHGDRKVGRVDAIILHYTGMASAEAALQRLCDPASQVSAHYVILEDGRIIQLVPEYRRAWHAGQSSWANDRDLNSASIGIEIVHPGHEGVAEGVALAYPPVQIDAVIALCKDITARHQIPQHRILAHSDIAPDRKIDPGEFFPWDRLAAEGVGHYVVPRPIEDGPRLERGVHGIEVEKLQALLAMYGYGIRVSNLYGPRTENVVRAFQRHFRPERVDGIADPSTIETLRALLAALPRYQPIPQPSRSFPTA
jgi:N-acetylmuramoyl-L-alanine amidase